MGPLMGLSWSDQGPQANYSSQNASSFNLPTPARSALLDNQARARAYRMDLGAAQDGLLGAADWARGSCDCRRLLQGAHQGRHTSLQPRATCSRKAGTCAARGSPPAARAAKLSGAMAGSSTTNAWSSESPYLQECYRRGSPQRQGYAQRQGHAQPTERASLCRPGP
jgi:hypothetical protein